MKEDERLSRRRFLTAAIAATALPLLLSGGRRTRTPHPRSGITGDPSGPLGEALPSRRSAIVLGEAYLEVYPEERHADHLAELIAHDWEGGARSLSRMTADHIRELVLAQVQRDFHLARTVEIDGWILSRTEARLCALSALT